MALKSASFSLAAVQSDAILHSCLHVIAFSIDQLLRRWRFVICLLTCQWGTASSRWSQRLVSRTGVFKPCLYNLHTFLHQSRNCV